MHYDTHAVGPNGLDYARIKVTLVNQDVPAAIYVQGLASRIARVRTTEKTYDLGKFLWYALTRVECPLMAQVSAKITADRHNEDRECIIPGIVCAGHCPWASAQGPRGSLRELNFLDEKQKRKILVENSADVFSIDYNDRIPNYKPL